MTGESDPPGDEPTEEVVQEDWRRFETPATGVVRTVAAATDCQVSDLPPLHDYVDADALNAVLRRPDHEVTVAFGFDGVEVAVSADGTIEVRP
jgi:hypothetical protein